MSETIRGFNITINGTKYFVRCNAHPNCRNQKIGVETYFGIHLSFDVKNLKTGEWLKGTDLKGTYEAEKIMDYVVNSINGQRSCYWNYEKPNENGKVVTEIKKRNEVK